MSQTRTVLFVCLHGAAKSVIAAHHLQRLARERGIALECTSAGVDPDDSVPPHVIDGLRGDGFEQIATAPRKLTPELLGAADVVVSMGCDLASAGPRPDTLVNWEGVPAVSDGFATARDDITGRLDDLLKRIEPPVKRALHDPTGG
jgi:arsenate reductase (thioredoxin)